MSDRMSGDVCFVVPSRHPGPERRWVQDWAVQRVASPTLT
jgi:hypothetical protein